MDFKETLSVGISVIVFIGVLGGVLITYYRKTKRANELPQLRWESNVLYESTSSDLNTEIDRSNNQELVETKRNPVDPKNSISQVCAGMNLPTWLQDRNEMLFPSDSIQVCQVLGKGHYGAVHKAKLTSRKAV